MDWSGYQNKDIVNRRAGGRRKINAERKARAWERRNKIKELIGGNFLLLGSSYSWGMEATLAEYFGVHRSTICRDKEALLVEWRKDHICPGCGAMSDYSLKALARLARRGIDLGCTASVCRRVEAALEAYESRHSQAHIQIIEDEDLVGDAEEAR